MAKNHLIRSMLVLAKERVDGYKFKSQNIIKHTNVCLKIFALNQLRLDHHNLLITGYFDKSHTILLKEAYDQLLNQLRPAIIPLVEYNRVFDETMLSTIGNKYGDIYEKAFEVAKATKLNKEQVPSYYEKYMKPIMKKYPAPKL